MASSLPTERHGVRDQHHAVGALGGERHPQRRSGHVVKVDDEAAKRLALVERGADRAGLAARERRHGVEEVRVAGQAAAAGFVQRVGVGARVAGGDHDAGLGELGNRPGGHHFRGERHQRAAPLERRHDADIFRLDRAHAGRVVHALPLGIEERALPDGCRARPARAAASAARAASTASAMCSRVSVISVGRKPVVPKRRCAAPIAAMPSTLRWSLKSTPPPPFTCTSM